MNNIFNRLDIILAKIRNDINGIRQILRENKSEHRFTSTKELNDKYFIDGYKFIKRNGILQLVRNGQSINNQDNQQPNVMNDEGKSYLVSEHHFPHVLVNTDNDAESMGLSENREPHFHRVLSAGTESLENEEEEVEQPQMNYFNTRYRDETEQQGNRGLPKIRETENEYKLSLEEQVENLAKFHAQEKAKKQAEEHAKQISKSLITALQNQRTKEDENVKNKSSLSEERKRLEMENFIRQQKLFE
jgi:hypothetical protein